MMQIRKVSINSVKKYRRPIPETTELFVVRLRANFVIELFGFVLEMMGRMLWRTNWMRSVSIYGPYGTWKQSGGISGYSEQGEPFAFQLEIANPTSVLHRAPYAFLVRERDGVIHFWTLSNFGYSIRYSSTEKAWFATFYEPIGNSLFASDQLAGFRFEELPWKAIVPNQKFAATVGNGIVSLRSDGRRVTYEILERSFDTEESINFSIADEYRFFKLPYQDRFVVQRGDHVACYETHMVYPGDPEKMIFGRFFVRRFPVWKQPIRTPERPATRSSLSRFISWIC